MMRNRRLRYIPRSVFEDERLCSSFPPAGILERLSQKRSEIYYRAAFQVYENGKIQASAMGAFPDKTMPLSQQEAVYIRPRPLWF